MFHWRNQSISDNYPTRFVREKYTIFLFCGIQSMHCVRLWNEMKKNELKLWRRKQQTEKKKSTHGWMWIAIRTNAGNLCFFAYFFLLILFQGISISIIIYDRCTEVQIKCIFIINFFCFMCCFRWFLFLSFLPF